MACLQKDLAWARSPLNSVHPTLSGGTLNWPEWLLLADQRLSGEWQAPISWRTDLSLYSAISSALSPAITGELPVLPVAHGDNPTALPYLSISR